MRTPLPAVRAGVRVSYGHESHRVGTVSGGAVKLARLAKVFPDERNEWNLLYLASSALPLDARVLATLASRRGAKLVWNQDGVLYSGLGIPGFERMNRTRARLLHAADYVFFQSEFSKESADRCYGEREEAWEILYNAVDTSVFIPAPQSTPTELTLLLGGSQYQRYRIDVALRTLALLPEARLIVTGALSFDRADRARAHVLALADDLGVRQRLELTGPYAQADAPSLLQRAHLLLHTKYNDPCPGVVVEAMACGLPVIYSASGGVPELVGSEAGIGVPAPRDFESDHPPAPEDLAAAVRAALPNLDELALAARSRAVHNFDLRPWIERHRIVFENVIAP